MSWNGIGDEGAKLVAEAVPVSDTLTSLSLVSNRISPLGLRDVMVALTTCKSFKKLDVSPLTHCATPPEQIKMEKNNFCPNLSNYTSFLRYSNCTEWRDE